MATHTSSSTRGIQWRLALMVAVLLIPLYGMVVWSYASERADALATSQEELQRLLNALLVQQEREVEGAQQYLLALSHVPTVMNRDITACNAFFPELLKDQPLYANIALTNLGGDIICSAVPLKAPVNVADRDYFKNAIATGNFSFGTYQIGRITGKPSVNIGYPVHDVDGRITGVLYVALNLEWLNELVTKLDLPAAAALTVVDHAGTILVRYPNSFQWMGSVAQTTQIVQYVLAHGDEEGYVESVGVDGVPRLYAYAPMPGDPALHPYAFIGFSESQLYADANVRFAKQMSLLALLTLFIIAMTWLAGRVLIVEQFKGLQRVNQLKTQFVSLASHQIRSPLTSIRWVAESLTDGSLGRVTKRQKEALSQIEASSDRLLALVRELLNISRIESDRIEVNPERTDLADIVKDVILELSPQAAEKQIRLVTDFSAALPHAHTDPVLVRQVLHNLIQNAIKYTRPRGRVRVGLDVGRGEIRCEVRDNGIGIPAKEQHGVFEQFYRASNTHEVVSEGTGLGLYLAKRVVELLGGRIGFSSQEEKGSTFWFTVPVNKTRTKKGSIRLNT